MKRALKNFRIRLKMITSHGTIAVLAVLCSTLALYGVAGLIVNLTTLHEDAMGCFDAAADLMYATSDIDRDILGTISGGSTDYYSQMEASVNENIAAIQTAFETLDTHLGNFCETDAVFTLSEQLEQMFNESEPVRTRILQYLKNGEFAEADTLYMEDYRVSLSRITAAADELKSAIYQAADDYCVYSRTVSNGGVLVILVLIVVCLIIGTLLTHIVSDSVRLPVTQLMAASEQMKEGNLSAADSITYESNDELGNLAASMRETMQFLHSYITEISDTLHRMANGDLSIEESSITEFRGDFASIRESMTYILSHLNSTLGSINQAAEQVNSGAVQIASGAQTLAQGASEQAASVEELSSAVADISQQINMTAANANSAMESTRSTSDQAEMCSVHMEKMMAAMADITDKSSQINRIIKTIDDIAFQTNILALNAAVEAARAGAAGKGFAVVADEVRNLAAKSAEAAKNTTELIESTVSAVNNGTKVLADTADTLAGVVNDSRKASDLAGQIADAAAGQATAVVQISQSIEVISGVVNSTSSTAEESAASSQELSGQATMLSGMLEQFKLRQADAYGYR
ncbi:MAG: MCP four helix bundle domain-containing protein [Oscillospiraceae bacterium]|nr:MCP four helix bundle domain-containing protein [Oscillospiraceae bacterium]